MFIKIQNFKFLCLNFVEKHCKRKLSLFNICKNMLAQLLYISKRSANCTQEEIKKILASAQKNNPELGITGLLLYSDTRFIQYIEGERTKLMPFYDNLKKDERHHDTILMSLSLVKERIFPNWHMGEKLTSEDNINYISDITKEDKMVFDGVLEGSEDAGQRIQRVLQKFL